MSETLEPPSSRDQFGPVAEAYLTSGVHASSDALEVLVEMVKPSGGKVLDIGTGAGHTAYAFAPYVDSVTAFDLTPEMLAIVSREAKARGLTNISTVEGDAMAMPFEDAAFDGVTCRLCAHHFSDVPKFVREVGRVLEPGGWFLLVDTVSPEGDAAAESVNEVERLRDPSHAYNLKDSEWLELLRRTGFEVLATDSRRKALNFDEWADRMRVSDVLKPTIRELIARSSGEVAEYFAPREEADGYTFDLIETAFFARLA